MIRTDTTSEAVQPPEAVLADLIEEITEKIEAGEHIDLAHYEAQHPAVASQLARLVPALQALDDLGLSAASSANGQPISTEGTPGQLGDFRILHEIGRGGMGVVYEAEQLSIGRRVALKVLPFAAMLDKRQLNRFKNEARAAGTLDHPNIVSVLTVGTERGVHYYAMQLVEGQSLAELIAERRKEEGGKGTYKSDSQLDPGNEDPTVDHDSEANHPQSAIETRPVAALSTVSNSNTQEYFRTVAQLGIQAAEALDYAHQNGIVHRDVKPGNLLVDAEGKLYVTDFGLARIEADAGMTMTGDLLGTLRYMSPEQALAKRVVIDHRTDVYSLGATLYELLAVQPAYSGGDRQELLKQIAFEDPQKLRQLNSRIPVDLETIVTKAMEKETSGRYETAQELADDLRRFLSDEPIHAKRPTPGKRFAKWASRNRPLVVGIALAFAAALMLGATYVWSQHQRTLRLEAAVGESLAAARAYLESREFESALRQISHAESRMNEAGHHDTPLSQAVATLSEEVTNKYNAEKLLIRFQELRRTRSYREALELYHVLEPCDLDAFPEFQHLNKMQQANLREDLAESLFLMAYYGVEGANGEHAADDSRRQAIDLLKRIESVYGPTRGAFMYTSAMWEALGENVLARRAKQRANEITPTCAVDYYMLSWGVMGSSRVQDLEHSYRALDRRPDHMNSFSNAGWNHQCLNQWAESEAMYTGFLALNPVSSWGYVARARARFAQGKFDQAFRDLSKADALQDGRDSALTTRGSFLERQGKHAEALALYQKRLSANPGNLWTRSVRGNLYHTLGDHDKAIDDFTVCVDTNGKLRSTGNPWHQSRLLHALVDRAFAYADSGQVELARADIAAASSVDASWARWYLAWFYATCSDVSLREPDQALSVAQELLDRSKKSGVLQTPRGARYWSLLGVAQYRAGDIVSAAEAFDKARQLDRHELHLPGYGHFAAMSRWRLGQQDVARELYQRTLNATNWLYNDWRERHVADWQLPGFRKEAAELLGIDADNSGWNEKATTVNSKASED